MACKIKNGLLDVLPKRANFINATLKWLLGTLQVEMADQFLGTLLSENQT
jgi:hypothetical protein